MHDGCSRHFLDGKQILQKIRTMGFAKMALPDPLEISCGGCGRVFSMRTMESSCPSCHMIHAVTPCHASSPENVMPAGIGSNHEI